MKSYRVSFRLPTGNISATIIQAYNMQEVVRLIEGLYPGASIIAIDQLS